MPPYETSSAISQEPPPTVFHAIPEMAHFCFHVLDCQLRGLTPLPAPHNLANDPAAVFIGWYHGSRLRGCIGSLVPSPLHEMLRDRAIDAAFNDRRFSAIRLAELPALSCVVNVLHTFEAARDRHDWTIGVHGLSITFSDPQRAARVYRSTYLPSVMVKFEMTKEAALRELVRKSGYNGPISDILLRSLQVTRFQSSELECGFQEYAEYYSDFGALPGPLSEAEVDKVEGSLRASPPGDSKAGGVVSAAWQFVVRRWQDCHCEDDAGADV